ncbi:methyltransferase [Parahaliea maris]|uniref:Methyltransferase n=1 Tax=Parahaliea maris TaxID=2716870 RepID=A0A5C9A0D9_9GAMM|nr:methyltransferase [Parahaliea maris]TXS92881.1 methyltransferase [Parahaliea maris]
MSAIPDQEAIMQLGTAFWGSRTLLSAVELGLFTELAAGPKSGEDIRQRLGLHRRSATDFLDALVALGMLCRENGLYSNTPDTDALLDRNKPAYIGGLLEMFSARLFRHWANLTEALKTGVSLNDTENDDPFEVLYDSPDHLKQFLSAMTAISLGPAKAAAELFPWNEFKSFIDVGCAQGGFTAQIAMAHPHLTGGGFDLPQVGPIFDDYMSSQGVSERMTFYPGNFFEDALPPADVIVMGHILHDWDLEQKRALVQKAYDALPEGGAYVVYEALIDNERRENAFGLLMSLNMLIETPGVFDYTGADCEGWMKDAGFRATRTVHLVGPDSMVIATK